jgi:peptide/nickel transport system substrate-binding protein
MILRMPHSVITLLLVLTVACTAPARPSPQGGASPEGSATTQTGTKMLVVGIVGNAEGFGFGGSGGVTGGGWATASEIHSNGLITSDAQSRQPIGAIAETVPSLNDGSMSVLPDGRVRVVYRLRTNVTWQDGVPLTAEDLVFSHRAAADPGLPFTTQARQVVQQIESTAAPDSHTFEIIFRHPYYQAATMGLRPFWPYPRHLLEEAFDRYQASGNSDDFLNLPYWTGEYVHLGPFRLTEFDPGDGLSFRAYEGYYRGRPKVDVVKLKYYANDNVLFSNLLAGAADIFLDSTLRPELERQLAERWRADNGGKVIPVVGDGGRYVTPQFRPEFQVEQATLDPRVRAAFYHALDRDAFAEAQLRPDLAAYGIRPPSDLFYDATKDALRRYAYDPNRAWELLQGLGWITGPDGKLRNAGDGRPFHTAINSNPGTDPQVAILADYWRRIGAEVDEQIVSPALMRDNEYLARYPGWELTGNRADAMLNRLSAPPSSAATRWAGNNRGGFVDPVAEQLVTAFVRGLTRDEQLQAITKMSDYVAAQLPVLMLMYDSGAVGVRSGVIALDDVAGGGGGGMPYGLYTRNAHLWDRAPAR